MLYKPRDTDHYLKESKIQLAHFHSLNIIIATLGSELFNMPSYNSYLEAQNFSNALDKFRQLKTRILYLELPPWDLLVNISQYTFGVHHFNSSRDIRKLHFWGKTGNN